MKEIRKIASILITLWVQHQMGIQINHRNFLPFDILEKREKKRRIRHGLDRGKP